MYTIAVSLQCKEQCWVPNTYLLIDGKFFWEASQTIRYLKYNLYLDFFEPRKDVLNYLSVSKQCLKVCKRSCTTKHIHLGDSIGGQPSRMVPLNLSVPVFVPGDELMTL